MLAKVGTRFRHTPVNEYRWRGTGIRGDPGRMRLGTRFLIAASIGLLSCSSSPPQPADEAALRAAFANASGEIMLPAGRILIDRPLEIRPGASGVTIRGHAGGSLIQFGEHFSGKAAILARDASNLRFSGFAIDGNRGSPRPTPVYLPPSDVTFADFYQNNGIVALNTTGLVIEELDLSRISGFPILVSASRDVLIDSVRVSDSGSLNSIGRNNTSGGILIEEGVQRFTVRRCVLERVAGNAIWTHSNYHSPRNSDGVISANRITGVARDAIQVGHATRVSVRRNRGARIGFPIEHVDREGQGNPVAVDSAGDVDLSEYSDNHFRDVNGHCIDLDGFHHGQVLRNSCINLGPDSDYPLSTFGAIFNNTNIDMTSAGVVMAENVFHGFAYGGIYAMGLGHRIINNYLLDINRARCTGDPSRNRCQYAPEEPGALRSGVFLTRSGARPAETRGNLVQDNVVVGYGMDRWCAEVGPGVDAEANVFKENKCFSLEGEAGKAGARP